MKNRSTLGLLVACTIAFQSLSAQLPTTQQPVLNKATAITQLPQKLECNIPALQKLQSYRLADKVNLAIGDYEFSGELVDKVQSSNEVVSMNIRSTSMPGAFCTVSVISQSDNSKKLVGRIINPKSEEVLVLTEENNQYFWVKKRKEHFLVE